MDLVQNFKNDFEQFKGYKNISKFNLKQVRIGEDPPEWDLSFMYKNQDDKNILEDIKKAQKKATLFKKKYSKVLIKGKLSTSKFLAALIEYEEIINLISKPMSYFHAVHSIQLKDQVLLTKIGQAENISANVMKDISFFENDLARTSASYKKKILKSKDLGHYQNFLNKVFVAQKYLLPQELELLLIDKDINGRGAWQSFRDIYESKFDFMFKAPEDKELRKYSLSEISKISKHNDPQTRFDGVEMILRKYKDEGDVYTYIYNSLIQDMIRIEKDRRGFKTLITKRNLNNELTDKQVNTMLDTISQNYKVAQRYWKLKAKILGLEKLRNCDVYAPFVVKGREKKHYSYIESITFIQNALNNFHRPIGDLFENMYRCNLVHAKVVDGKRGGAFCMSARYREPSIVMANFLGELRDISTIAHEGGHWLHHALSSEHQTALTLDIPLTTAETASVFNEMILASMFMEKFKDEPEMLLQFTMEKIDDIFATVFRQAAFSRFEQTVFSASEKMPLTQEQFSDHFVKEYGALFGDAVSMTEHFRYEWARIPHFIHTPFYVYAYSFGELATIALYQHYLEKPEGFGAKYIKFLSLGSEKKPEQLYKIFNIDINKKETWAAGFKYINSLIDDVEQLFEKIKNK